MLEAWVQDSTNTAAAAAAAAAALYQQCINHAIRYHSMLHKMWSLSDKSCQHKHQSGSQAFTCALHDVSRTPEVDGCTAAAQI
jgi:hypothetical protein